MNLDRVVNVNDMRDLARRRLPKPVYDLIEGGSGDEVTLRRNRSGFDRIALRPRPLVDVARRDTSTTVFGDAMSLPVLLAPTGAARVAHPEAEMAVIRAAETSGTFCMQGAVSAYELEDIARASRGPLWYQLYMPSTRDEVESRVKRLVDAGYTTLTLTIDTPVLGNRERDMRNRVTIPARVTPKLLWQGAQHPAWALNFVRTTLPGRSRDGTRRLSPTATQGQIVAASYPVTLEDVELLRALWPGRLLVKGVMRGDDCDQFVELGIDGVVVSNHGARQLDGLPASIEVLPEVVEAAAGRMAVILDGGIRRGTDVIKAIALGADAVMVGRPYLFGLAVAGEAGVAKVLSTLRLEIDRTMALIGVRTLDEVDPTFVSRRCACGG